ncbi:acyl-CoA carboxylase subunit epsilon [Propionibacteriaceae bacterium G1746]|uniref:acyl-CoA carboxylase subunit epsilon n=1 Tax=Aestuariimicrobium sp. G57 TaxID=3418485 RepID=UPI003C24C47E
MIGKDIMDDTEQTTPPAQKPIGVAKGNPTDDELAAAIAVLSVVTAPLPNPQAAKDRPVAGGWSSYWRTLRRDHRPGFGAWTARN